MDIVDLHTHSNVSDGSCTPTELIAGARAAGLAGIALTDHDTIDGVAEAAAAARRDGVRFLPGMEMSVRYKERQLHVVALGFDAAHPEFRRLYAKIRAVKEAGIEETIERIRRMGADISREKVGAFSRGAALDRYAIMRYFVSLRRFDDVQEIWDRYINPALGPQSDNVAAEAAFAAIRAAGGVTSLAHFHKRLGLGGLDRAAQEAEIAALAASGLDGMELYYPNYSDDDARFAAAMVEKYALLPTGGTDFHGANRPAVALGTGISGNTAVPRALYDAVLRRCLGGETAQS